MTDMTTEMQMPTRNTKKEEAFSRLHGWIYQLQLEAVKAKAAGDSCQYLVGIIFGQAGRIETDFMVDLNEMTDLLLQVDTAWQSLETITASLVDLAADVSLELSNAESVNNKAMATLLKAKKPDNSQLS